MTNFPKNASNIIQGGRTAPFAPNWLRHCWSELDKAQSKLEHFKIVALIDRHSFNFQLLRLILILEFGEIEENKKIDKP